MIILDTNVLSALMRAGPDPAMARLDRQPAESVWITSITLFETRFGLALLPSGRRRRVLEAAFERLLNEDLENRVLDFDSAAANAAALLAAARQKMGQKVDIRWRGTPLWRPETCGTLRISNTDNLILGSLHRDDKCEPTADCTWWFSEGCALHESECYPDQLGLPGSSR